jgi:beta-galactosidase
MARAERWLLPWMLVGCNAVFGIHRHEHHEQPELAVGAGAAGAPNAATDGGDSSGPFVALWSFETLLDDRVPSAIEPSVPLTVQQGELSSGPTGNYLVLDGSGSAVAPGPIIDASGSFSVSVWVRLDRPDVWSTFASQDGRAISSFYLQRRDSNYLAFTTYASDSPGAEPCVATAGLRPRQGEWYHVVATRDSQTGEQRIYVDGLLSGKATCAGGFQTDGPLVVGRGKWNAPTDWTSGGIDELGVSDRVLSAGEIVDLYHLGRPDAHHYLYAYFQEVEEARGDGLHFAHSHDALSWDPVGGGRVFLSPAVGGSSFRDPHLLRDPSGKYHLVWTSSCMPWAAKSACVQDRGFGYATSDDLVTFSEQRFIEVPAEKLNAEHFWAPETFYDARTEQYLVSWASPLDATPNADPHSIYYLLTKDFVTFSEPAVLYGRADRDLIDATIVQQDGSYLMFMKDEAATQKNLRVVTSLSLFGEGAWPGEPSAPLTGTEPAEGPAPLIQDGRLLLLFDRYAGGGLGGLRSRNLVGLSDVATWEDVSSSVFAAPIRHGSVVEVPHEVFRAVALRAAQ